MALLARKIDLAIGLVLVAAVGFSLLGVAIYEPDAGDTTFAVRWSTSDEEVPEETATRAGAGEVVIEVPVELVNVTALEWTVSITASGPRLQAATWRAGVQSPNETISDPEDGSFAAGAGQATAEATFPFEIEPVPSVATVQAGSEEEAMQELEGEYNATAANGTWRIVVTFGGGNPQGLSPETYSVRVQGAATVFEATVTTGVPDVESR